ncbi:MAG: CARDB domain-containing protein [bacterium]|nr:CARDB domain-containing protein [bacterium]
MDILITDGTDTVVAKRNVGPLRKNAVQKYNLALVPGLHPIRVQVSIDTQVFIAQKTIAVNYPLGTPVKLAVHPAEIGFTPSPTVSGEAATVQVPIHNLGSIASSPVQLSLWNGPAAQIDREQTFAAISAYSCRTVSFNWNTRGKTGKQEISVRLNQETVAVMTTELLKQADISIRSEDIGFSKPKYTDGETVFMLVTVRNLGDVPAKQVEITGFAGDPRRGGRLLENMASWENLIIPEIPGQGAQGVRVRWDAYDNTGDRELFVTADRNNRIPDANRDNNTGSKKIHIRTKANLDIVSKEIIKSPDVKTSRKVTLVATVKNTGETDAENVIIQFYDGEDKETRVAVGDETLLPVLKAGEEYTTRVDWSVPEEKEKKKHNINVEVGTKQSVWKTFESLPPSR